VIVLKPEEMRKVDQLAIDAGFPDLLLMETAGRGVALKAVEVMKQKPGRNILIIAGKGNNGGDGLVAARYLQDFGFNTKVILLTGAENLSGSPLINYRLCQLKSIKIISPDSTVQIPEIEKMISRADLLIDAMLGTGISGSVREPVTSIIELMNNSGKTILAVDIPSGISGETGKVLGKAVYADYTVTMAYPKTGLLVYPGRDYSGEIEIVDLGVPEEYALKVKPGCFTLTSEEAAALLPGRQGTGHKGTFGKVGIIGGSPGMSGAPSLTGLATLRTGAGLVKVAVPGKIQSVVASFSPELITCSLKELSLNGAYKQDHEYEARNGTEYYNDNLIGLDDLIEQFNVLAAGPGLGQRKIITDIIYRLLREFQGPLVLDADGLNAIKSLNVLKDRKEPLIITPHPGEMARLLGATINEIQEKRIEIARNFSTEYGLYLVLKGASTIIALPDGRIYINLTGNEGMATAGSGDVLTGIITGLLAQGVKAEEAAILGPYLHGLAGNLAREEKSSFSLIAGDLITYLDAAFNRLLGSH